ncbi:hypothetical protein HanRHA438_Chr03g0119491 [Helianthus annuus]|nr:hypothetical protein HanRHA438_Chr03g0119491 [Helianthus annuus]
MRRRIFHRHKRYRFDLVIVLGTRILGSESPLGRLMEEVAFLTWFIYPIKESLNEKC